MGRILARNGFTSNNVCGLLGLVQSRLDSQKGIGYHSSGSEQINVTRLRVNVFGRQLIIYHEELK